MVRSVGDAAPRAEPEAMPRGIGLGLLRSLLPLMRQAVTRGAS